MANQKHLVIIPTNITPRPSPREISAAYILADYFQTNVQFLPRSNQKTPDFLINGLYWELKTSIGTGKYNIQHLLQKALKQSTHIIIDARFSKLHINKIKHELTYQCKKTKKLKQLLLIDKQKKVIEIYKKL